MTISGRGGQLKTFNLHLAMSDLVGGMTIHRRPGATATLHFVSVAN